MGDGVQSIEGPLVFDTSALFNFGHRGHLESLLDKLGSETKLLVPEEVLQEASEQKANRQYYQNLTKRRFHVRQGAVPSKHEEEIERLSTILGSGELAVIVLVLETRGTAVIDEPEARAEARAIGLKVIGTIGILSLAVQKQWITEADALAVVESLRSAGFRTPAIQKSQSFEEYLRLLEESE